MGAGAHGMPVGGRDVGRQAIQSGTRCAWVGGLWPYGVGMMGDRLGIETPMATRNPRNPPTLATVTLKVIILDIPKKSNPVIFGTHSAKIIILDILGWRKLSF